jgi:hypothetical protein
MDDLKDKLRALAVSEQESEEASAQIEAGVDRGHSQGTDN